MTPLTSIAPRMPAYRTEHLALIEAFRATEARVRAASQRAERRFRARGQLLPRERVALLLDRDAPFLELSTLAGLGMHEDDGRDDVYGGGNIIGIGVVRGVRCLVAASDSGIKGGAAHPMGVEKAIRAQEIALANKLPYIQLVESAGANLFLQAEMFVRGGATFANMARLSAAGIPVISVVHGSSTAGGAYQTGLADHVVLVRGRSKVFLAGPPLLRAATGEIADDESLGGAVLHTDVSGVGDYLAEDDADALRIARDIVGELGWDHAHTRPAAPPPRYPAEDLLYIVPPDYRTPYDVREVIARIADDSAFLDFKPSYGPHTVCGRASIEGHPVGILGNNGGVAAERAGIVKHGSKMIQAVTNAPVPKITLQIGASFGAGHYGMCGRAFGPRFVFSWPNNRIAVMGGEQAACVMRIVAEEGAKAKGEAADTAKLDAMTSKIIRTYDAQSTALYATARLWDDGIIDPRDTREVLGLCLSICAEADARTLHPNTFGIARL